MATLIFSCSSNQKINPPNAQRISDNLYIDKYPITNQNYKEFLYCIELFWNNQTSDFLNKLPDFGYTMQGYDKEGISYQDINFNFTYNTPSKFVIYGLENNYFDSILYNEMLLPLDSLIFDSIPLNEYLNHRVYSDFPVLYVNKKQAETYCKWRSDMVNLRIGLESKDSSTFSKYAAPVKFRLPTKEEWIRSYEISLNNKKKKNKYTYLNEIEPVNYVYKNYNKKAKFHFYSQQGKLSEIIQEDLIINYNWMDTVDIQDSIVLRTFNSAFPGVGFRCVCEITE
jgi:formylglycine-generating enzyme required for sulfatase activity